MLIIHVLHLPHICTAFTKPKKEVINGKKSLNGKINTCMELASHFYCMYERGTTKAVQSGKHNLAKNEIKSQTKTKQANRILSEFTDLQSHDMKITTN